MDRDGENRFIQYEYKEVFAEGERASLLTDCYESLGWEMDGRDGGTKKIMFRRNRKIVNKMELTRLQRNLEACIAEIDMLQKSKSSKAAVISLTIGLVGTAFMAGSVFAVTASTPVIWLCIILAVPAFGLWALAPILYPRLVAKRSAVVNELIEKKYDEIYKICEKGNALLH